ncbi:Era Like 12S Mitochondrial RRNA Chaperone 1 [Lunasporangiospora selenospora]|uniref:Era Like 12S Mitochondrial RRNA Chaperone 1 n=1 Tax=Lunasporangiospora selenospora TaxID=979761 RepID=A0A9P6KD21_9FUNG|nr:Era Like 12S Mitochondrial RRNA Chaperone 1 [Lunasporangiospora selenospora]
MNNFIRLTATLARRSQPQHIRHYARQGPPRRLPTEDRHFARPGPPRRPPTEDRRFARSGPPRRLPTEDMIYSSRSLELLKKTLEDKKTKLKEIRERYQGVVSTEPSEEDTSQKTERNSNQNEEETPPVRKSKTPDLTPPLFVAPADMSLRLPKAIEKFEQPKDPHTLKIAIIGSPNVGKSTIVNDLVRSTVSVVSVRPHTTRERVSAVMTSDNKQVVFYDTPGVVPEKNISRLNRELVTASWKAIEEADHLLIVMDCRKLLKHTLVTEDYIFQRLEDLERKVPATLVFNKMDLVNPADEKLQDYENKACLRYPHFVKSIYTTTQAPRNGMPELRSHLLRLAQPGDWMFPPDMKSDRSVMGLLEDLIRAEIYETFKLPYHIKQENAGWTEMENNVLRIDQNLIVNKPGLKKMLVGTQGQVIADITQKARKNIGSALQRRIMLNLQVKIRK